MQQNETIAGMIPLDQRGIFQFAADFCKFAGHSIDTLKKKAYNRGMCRDFIPKRVYFITNAATICV